jgi:hypothetical protein
VALRMARSGRAVQTMRAEGRAVNSKKGKPGAPFGGADENRGEIPTAAPPAI